MSKSTAISKSTLVILESCEDSPKPLVDLSVQNRLRGRSVFNLFFFGDAEQSESRLCDIPPTRRIRAISSQKIFSLPVGLSKKNRIHSG